MNIGLHQIASIHNARLKIAGSKSETNRLLLLQALHPNLQLENAADADDSEVMRKALSSSESIIDIHHAGTAMRFLTAYFAIQEGREVVLTGSSRMKERPIQVLVDALRELGADIAYEEQEGFPPLRIKGKKLDKREVTLAAHVSSQYISALLLIASKLESGLQITLEGEITSVPYIQMTINLLKQIGIKTEFNQNKIIVFPTIQHTSVSELAKQSNNPTITIESDWSSASYFYSIITLSEVGTTITLSSFQPNSLQGDAALATIYKNFGVETTFNGNSITLRKINLQLTICNLQLNNTPDIAQTIAVTCFGLGIACHLSGLHTLKIKETDRLTALKNELTKLGANVSITHDSLALEPSTNIHPNIKIATYNDHRMAMAFAPLALKVPIVIQDSEVVSKSYPNFWNDLKRIGFVIQD
ncbi:3-phosphoshikimate 1-carboxyvinyltransferase [Flavobacterium sp.]|uniref:3-phosphoshikimate 1-carboxyvinyltransferase n=1 Tax=Flavobacterium sp. TaxID=239 RepID=UPI00286D2C46|nr:3-phosphoshikimate 1-carboxyvinyltransferase [Flavobacterium sp.]